MSQGGNKKVSNNLVALSSAAILAVYTAGYSRTQSAADRIAARAEARRPAAPATTEPARPIEAAAPLTAIPAPVEIKRESVRPPIETAKAAPVVAPSPVKKSDVPTPAVASAHAVAEPSVPVVAPVAPATPAPTEPKVEAKVETPVAPVMPAPPAKPVWKDGSYTGWGYSRHGDIQALVVIEGGRIISTTIANCATRYSCSVIDELIPQPPKRQSPDVDNVSGATQSADAFYYGIVEALSKAK